MTMEMLNSGHDFCADPLRIPENKHQNNASNTSRICACNHLARPARLLLTILHQKIVDCFESTKL